MATLNISLRTDKKPDKNGGYQLHLRLTHKRKHRYLKLFPFNVRKNQWSDRSRSLRATFPKYAQYNQKISEVYETAQQAIDFCLIDNPHATIDDLRQAIEDKRTKAKTIEFIAFAREMVQGLRDEQRVRYAERCGYVVEKLAEYSNGHLPFPDIDVEFLRRYKTYLKKEKKNSQNTIYGNFKVLRTFYRQAILEGHTTQADNPFFLFTVKQETIHKEHLNLDHITKLTQLELKNRKDVVRDCFLFSFWCAGIRFSDICKLKWTYIKNGTTLEYTMGKTKASAGSHKQIELSPPALNILEKYQRKIKSIRGGGYIFPWLDSKKEYTPEERVMVISSKNAYTNKLLKDLAKDIGFTGRLTFHLARHTFTSIADEVADLSVKELQELLGHSDARTTELYRNSLNKNKGAIAMRKFYDSIEKAIEMD